MPTPTCVKVQRQGHLAYAGFSDNGERTAVEFWLAEYTGADASCVIARGATDGTNTMPTRGVAHPDDASLRCKTLEIRPVGENTRRIFQGRAEYTDAPNILASPLDRPVQIEWDFSESGQEPYFIDCSATPKPVVNSAGERFSEFLQRETGSITVTYTKNYAPGSVSPTIGVTYHKTVNNGSLTIDGQGLSANQVRLVGTNLSPVQVDSGVSYRTLKLVLKLRPTWDDVVDDRGLNEKYVDTNDGSRVKTKAILRGAPPQPVSDPWPLNGSGVAKANITDAPAQLTFKPYTPTDYSPLGLA